MGRGAQRAPLRLRRRTGSTKRPPLYREDDNAAHFLIARYVTQVESEAKAAELALGGHKQGYFVELNRQSLE